VSQSLLRRGNMRARMASTEIDTSICTAQTLRILYVEDNPHDARLCLRQLKQAGFEPMADVVGTPEEFTERLRSTHYDLVLADYRIPGWSGMAALEVLQQEQKELPFILVTGALGEAAAVECIKKGAADFIVKDHSSRLPLVVQRALEERALREEKTRAEAALRDSERRFRALVENSADGSALVTADGTYVYSSPASNGVLGYTPKELAGRNVFELIHSSELKSAREMFTQLIGEPGRVLAGHFRFHHKNGSWRWVQVVGKNLLGDPSVGAVVINYRDVTESKRADDELVASEERFRKAFNASPEPMTISHWPEGRYVDCNESFLRITGYRREEVIGRTDTEVGFWPKPEDRARCMRFLEEHARAIELEVVFGAKSGEKRTGLFSAEVIEIRGEQCVLAVMKDVTERRSLEEQLRLSQKMEAVGQLAGGVAHDFNNLLTVILGYGVLLLRDLGSEDPRRAPLEGIREAANRAAALTQQLLAFSRRQVLAPRLLDLNVVVADMDKMLRRLIGEHIELLTVLAPELGLVRADPSQIEQVIMNLVVNARDAMPTGGKLTIETADMELDEDYARRHAAVAPGPYVMLAVSDTGHGMDEETRARVFEPFFTTKAKGKGTGLGLAVVYGIIKQSGGSIWVYSELGLGTTFKAYLPKVEARPEATTANRKSRRGTETVLLVENAAAVRSLLRGILESNGYEVLETRGAAEALEASQQHAGPIQLLLTDAVMPDMSGRELADRLKIPRPEVKVLYLSGYTDTAVVQHGLLEPGVAFLQKPFTPEVLSRRVREVLDT
jgi:two-component system, cell cycle sensor histidine kinase and response regulator CckA